MTNFEFEYQENAEGLYESYFAVLSDSTNLSDAGNCEKFSTSIGFQCSFQNDGFARILVRKPTKRSISVRLTFSLPFRAATSVSEFKAGEIKSKLVKKYEKLTLNHFRNGKLAVATRKIRGTDTYVDLLSKERTFDE